MKTELAGLLGRLVGYRPEQECNAIVQLAAMVGERQIVRPPSIKDAGNGERAETASYSWHGG
jgi:hypothetical protein